LPKSEAIRAFPERFANPASGLLFWWASRR
jgi:hypothetical protein